VPAIIILWLVASWPIGLAVDPARLSKPGELAYLGADLAILVPLALATAISLPRRSTLALGFLVATLGALAYDATHFAVRTAQEVSGGMVRLALFAGLLLLLAVIGLGLRAALRSLGASYSR
jgi:Kef-type K+ transport system membrane component KefB